MDIKSMGGAVLQTTDIGGLRISKPFLGRVCFLVICGILTLGLWPFHSPANDARWIQSSNGLTFEGEGTAFSSRALHSAEAAGNYTVEILASSRFVGGGNTLLAFQNTASNGCPQVSLERSGPDLKIRNRVAKNYFQIAKRDLFADDVFRPGQLVFLTVTSSDSGTRVYADGRLVRASPGYRVLECGLAGRLIVGDSLRQNNGWKGSVRGLAVYAQELDAARVREHFQTWTGTGQPALEHRDRNMLLYLFDERQGKVAHDRGASHLDLEIPEQYVVLDKAVLPGFWDEFTATPGYWYDVLNNVVGFVPVGLSFSAYFAASSLKKPGLAAMLAGMALSLTIECVQPFLATRESGTTDLMTNALGTSIGVQAYAWLRKTGWICQSESSGGFSVT